MPNTVNDVIQKIKKHVDNDSFMYVFKNDSWSRSYKRSVLFKVWEGTSKSYYTEVICKRIVNENVVNIFYKNTNGVWIDYIKYSNTFPTHNVLTGAVIYEDYVKIEKTKIPRTIFMDENSFVYYIDEQDGDSENSLIAEFIDELDEQKVIVQPFSIDDITLPSTAVHMMQDVKVKVKNVPSDTVLVWFNGVFVPIIRDNTYEDVFYIKNGMTLVNTIVKDQRIDAPKEFINLTQYKTATIKENDNFNVYRFNFNIRIFKWKNVKVSDWLSPITTLTVPIVHNYSAIYIPKTLIFNTPINKNAHMLFENGVLIDPENYIIDPIDSRKVTLLQVENRATNLLNEIIQDVKQHPEIYGNSKPLNIIKSTLTEKSYNVVNFTTDTVNKTLYLKHSKACAVDFPYRHEITFPDINIGDIVIVDGLYSPYEWVHKYTIAFPIKNSTYLKDTFRIKESSVTRLSFIEK